MLKRFLSNWRKMRQRIDAIVALAAMELRIKNVEETVKRRQREAEVLRERNRRMNTYR